MRHFLYRMRAANPAPAGDGDTGSWFLFYKWNIDEENYVPQYQPFLDASPGDFLWFVMDGLVRGGAPVLRVENPSLPHQRQEVWYDTKESVDFGGDNLQVSVLHLMHPEIAEEVGATWLKVARRRF